MAEIDKEAFIAAVVHDMRAPLNACLMSLSLIELKASQPAEVLKSVEVTRRNLERQALLIEDLGDALQMVTGELALELEEADLAEIVDRAVQTLPAPAGGIEIGWRAGIPAGHLVSADPERLARAIGTLLEIVTAAAQPQSGDRVELDAQAAEGRVRLEMRRLPGLGAEGSPRRKRPVMRMTVAAEIVRRHAGRMTVEDDSASLELPLG